MPVLTETRQKPRVRGDCLEGGVNAACPCPWLDCRYNINESPQGKPNCALDVADDGGVRRMSFNRDEAQEVVGYLREKTDQLEPENRPTCPTSWDRIKSDE